MRYKTLLVGLLTVLAFGLIAAGCGGDDDETTTTAPDAAVEETTSPTTPEEAAEDAREALEDAPEDIDQAVAQCKENVEDSGLEGAAKQQALDLCESGGDAANEALESAEELQDQLGN
jgi:hypothetical protein